MLHRKILNAACLIVVTISLLFVTSQSVTPANATTLVPERPRLVLMLIVDQFRADYLMRFASRFLPPKTAGGVGGFRYLTENGAYYPLAEHEVLQCMTGPGHATLLTGAYPYQLGIPTNFWFDQKTQEKSYCVEDTSTSFVGGGPQPAHVGSSPKNMLGTTVSDEWKNAGYPGRVVSIAMKDRAAILMGGHRADLALWNDVNVFQWMSSKKYLPDGKLPDWVVRENEALAKEKGTKFTWKAEGKGTGYSDDSIGPDAKYVWGLGTGFPHEITRGMKNSSYTPYGIEVTRRLATAATDALKLGESKDRTDFLFVSLSAHDYMAHGFGPNSREMEEMTVAEDREIATLLTHLDRKVGLKNMTIILSADHGGAHTPEYLNKYGIDGGRIDQQKLRERGEELLEKKFGSPPKGQKWLPYVEDLDFYLNHPALDARNEKARFDAEEILRAEFSKVAGSAFVITNTDLITRHVPPGEIGRKVLLTAFPERSGDLILIPRSGWIMDGDYSTHMTTYSYDRYVPLVLTGRAFKPGRYAQTAHITDLAPTLSFTLGIVPPSLSEGRVLSEVLR